jgi:hypothetical protein
MHLTEQIKFHPYFFYLAIFGMNQTVPYYINFINLPEKDLPCVLSL